jgi:2-dehydro-3-deoxygluconokinase
MLRLSPPPGNRFRQTARFDVTYGGAEANVAASLAQWGIPSRFVTALPPHDLGSAAVD